jgi:hypothetical protein
MIQEKDEAHKNALQSAKNEHQLTIESLAAETQVMLQGFVMPELVSETTLYRSFAVNWRSKM